MAMMRPHDVPMVGIVRAQAEEVRLWLRRDGALLAGASPQADGERVWLPLTEEAAAAIDEGSLRIQGPVERRAVRFHRQQGSYRDLLQDLPVEQQEQLPVSYDLLGTIALVKVPEELEPLGQRIGDALHRQHPRLTAVFHDGGVHGPFRIRSLEALWGDGRSATVIHEHGATLRIDPAVAYFSPRRSTERQHVAAELSTVSGTLVDLTCGVGPSLVAIARASVVSKRLIGVDYNPAAVALARRNLATATSSLPPGQVAWEVHQGDSTLILPALPIPQVVLINHPTDPGPLLHAALRDHSVRAAGRPLRVVVYHLGDNGAPPRQWLEGALAAAGCTPSAVGWRQLHAYSPSTCLWGATLAFGAIAAAEEEPGRP